MTTETKVIGRNESCPCKSGKKYKRCCGVSAAPKITPAAPTPSAKDLPFDPSSLDPQMIAQFSKALQRLPRGQMQRLQGIMQKAMKGKDVSTESADFEKTLPADFQNMLKSWNTLMPQTSAALSTDVGETNSVSSSEMTLEQAKALVAQAADEGKIQKEEAQELLNPAGTTELPSPLPTESKLSQFWRNLSSKRKQ